MKSSNEVKRKTMISQILLHKHFQMICQLLNIKQKTIQKFIYYIIYVLSLINYL